MTGGARLRLGERGAAWVLLAPFLVSTGVFVVYPLVKSLFLSMSQTYGATSSEYVGGANYGAILSDPVFWLAVRNTVVFTLGSLLIQLPLALLLAVLLNRPGLKGRGLYRLFLFAPQLVGLVFAAMIGGVFFAKRTGLVNQVLHEVIGMSLDFPWLEKHIMATLILIALWLYVGFNMVYFLAALQSVDSSLEEAAVVDGANKAQRFLHVVIPSIRPVAGFVVLLSLIGSMQLFELPWIMLEDPPGPQSRGLTVMMYLYQSGFEIGDLGTASAVGWLLGCFLVAAAGAQYLVARREIREM